MALTTVDLTTCPACGDSAEVQWRSVLESTHGPTEHVKVLCLRRHWHLMPVAMLPTVSRTREVA